MSLRNPLGNLCFICLLVMSMLILEAVVQEQWLRAFVFTVCAGVLFLTGKVVIEAIPRGVASES